jgi:hypothetical protein
VPFLPTQISFIKGAGARHLCLHLSIGSSGPAITRCANPPPRPRPTSSRAATIRLCEVPAASTPRSLVPTCLHSASAAIEASICLKLRLFASACTCHAPTGPLRTPPLSSQGRRVVCSRMVQILSERKYLHLFDLRHHLTKGLPAIPQPVLPRSAVGWCAREHSALGFPEGLAVYSLVGRPALLPGEGHMGNVGLKNTMKRRMWTMGVNYYEST